MSSLSGTAGIFSIPPPGRAAAVRTIAIQDIEAVPEIRRAERGAGRWARFRPERQPAEQTAPTLPEAPQRSGSTSNREPRPQGGPTVVRAAQLVTQAAQQTGHRGAPLHPDQSARASEAYRRAGAEPAAYSSEATLFRIAV